MSLTFPADAKLKDGSPVQLVLADQQDVEPLRRLYSVIVEEGTSYPHDRFLDAWMGKVPGTIFHGRMAREAMAIFLGVYDVR